VKHLSLLIVVCSLLAIGFVLSNSRKEREKISVKTEEQRCDDRCALEMKREGCPSFYKGTTGNHPLQFSQYKEVDGVEAVLICLYAIKTPKKG
jgi:hypothetical protein